MEKNSFIKDNIVCNNCVGARMYEISKQQFPNPFMWSAIQCNDFVNLVENWNSVDLSNVEFTTEKYKNSTRESVLVTIDKKIPVHFVHYIKDKNKKEPAKELATDILFCDIIKYAKTKWFKRLERLNTQPVFLYSFNYADKKDITTYKNDLKKIINIKTNMKIIILIHKSLNIDYKVSKPNIKIIECDDSSMLLNGSKLAAYVKEILLNEQH